MKAITTTYNGYRFRSRLEARWAVFFDVAGITWRYEPEGYELPSGARYLPDFLLTNVNLRSTKDRGGMFAEIKPTPRLHEQWEVLEEFAGHQPIPLALLATGVPLVCASDERGNEGHFQFAADWDNNMAFMGCYDCQRIKFEYLESSYSDCNACGGECDWEHPRLLDAQTAARRARFEFGESGR